MKAYKVFYSTGRSHDSTIVLAEKEDDIESVLSEKDTNFKVESSWCNIESKKEIPLSSVMMKDLSVAEFLRLLINMMK